MRSQWYDKCREIYNVFENEMKEKVLEFLLSVDVQHHYVSCDILKVKQIIFNLLSNAYKYTAPGGKVAFSVRELECDRDGYGIYETCVEDNGIGMDEETLKNIKEMFYTTKQNGTGLGVALSNEIIKSHNGELLFTSELNKGTKVTIRLPY